MRILPMTELQDVHMVHGQAGQEAAPRGARQAVEAGSSPGVPGTGRARPGVEWEIKPRDKAEPIGNALRDSVNGNLG